MCPQQNLFDFRWSAEVLISCLIPIDCGAGHAAKQPAAIVAIGF